MSKFVAGIVAAKDKATVVYAEVPDDFDTPITILLDDKWEVQTGDRAHALRNLHKRVQGFFQEKPIDLIVIKGSAVAQGKSATLALLEGAETRGAVIAAAGSSAAEVRFETKAVLSRTYKHPKYPKRDVDAIVADDAYWDAEVDGEPLRKMSREAALLILATRTH